MDDVYEPPPVAVEVADYTLLDDPSFYNNHIFTLNVWMEQNTYRIQRSYAAFVELDYALRFHYPRSKIPTLPLSGAKSSATKAPARRFSAAVTQDPNVPSAASISEKTTKRKRLKRVDNTEAIGQKKTGLHMYMKDLLRVPEILVSEIMLCFLDEESDDGQDVEEFDEVQLENMEIPLLLQDEEVITKTVRKDAKIPVEVKFNTVLVWIFSTAHHDIGFSATYNGIEVLAYQRYNSHTQSIRGFLEIPNSGMIHLIWDNSYSKWRSKTLSYRVKAVDITEYDRMKQKALEIRSKKIQLFKQRIVLKKLLTKLSNDLLMVSNPSKTVSMLRSTMSDLAEDLSEIDASSLQFLGNEDVDVKGLFRQIEQLQGEKKFLQQSLSDSEMALVSERTACAESMRAYEQAVTAKEALVEEIGEVRNEMEVIKSEYQDYVQSMQKDLEGSIYPIHRLIQQSEQTSISKGCAIATFPDLLAFARHASRRVQELEEAQKETEQQMAKLKGERKKLREYGRESREQLETMKRDLAAIEHDRELVSKDNSNLKQRIETLEKTIAQYREAAAVADMAIYGTVSRREAPDTVHSNMDDSQSQPENTAQAGNARTSSGAPRSHLTAAEETALLNADDDDEVGYGGAQNHRGEGAGGGADEYDYYDNDDEDEDSPPRIIVHDFTKAEPDEMSQAFEEMAASLQSMIPSWNSLASGSNSQKGSSTSSGFFGFGF